MKHSICKADFIKIAESHGFRTSMRIRDSWFNPTLSMHISITDEEDPFVIINADFRPLKGIEFKNPKAMDRFIENQKQRLVSEVVDS